MKGSTIGELEEVILLIVAHLERAYGNEIVEELASKASRTVSLSTVHITLYRLEDKGFLKSDVGGASEIRGGRRKGFFSLTIAGMNVLKENKAQRMQLWSLIPDLNSNL